MVVRVKVRLRAIKGREGKTKEGIAVLNAGYESAKPEAIIPIKLAEELGLWPRLIEGTEVSSYRTAGGLKLRVYRIDDCLEVQIVTEDKVSDAVKTTAVIVEGEDEILLSDASISAHHIIIEDAKDGIWRFKGEDKLRKSELPQYW